MKNYIPLFLYEQPKSLNHFKLLQYSLKANPTLFHKKKSKFDPEVINNSNDEENIEDLEESYLFQDANNAQINELKNNINTKALTIEANAKNYLNFMLNNSKNKKNNNLKPINSSYRKSHNYSNINTPLKSFSNETEICLNNNFSSYDFNSLYNNSRNFSENNKFGNQKYKSIVVDKNFENDNKYNADDSEKTIILPKIYNVKSTDITNPNYYDQISLQLLRKKNIDILQYNKQLLEDKINKNKRNKITSNKDDVFSLPPGRISNIKYYSLGESRLKNNIIINPGNHCNSPGLFPNNYHKLKSEFT